jgi:hypothetical protein
MSAEVCRAIAKFQFEPSPKICYSNPSSNSSLLKKSLRDSECFGNSKRGKIIISKIHKGMEERLQILKGLLQKAYRLEAGLESEANFRGFIASLDDEQKKVLFKLISDSERHKTLLEKIAHDLGFKLENVSEEFSFSDRRIFNEIHGLEMAMKSLYENIAANFADVLGENVDLIKRIAKEEEMHAKLVEMFVDRTMRIL